ncbi:MAG: hypothetical protein AAF696_10245 [Bacteroidota bacterium]
MSKPTLRIRYKLLFLASLLWFACTEVRNPEQDLPIDPKHARQPPQAEDIFIRLEGDEQNPRLIVEAHIKKESFEGDKFSQEIDGNLILLRDDGQGFDLTPQDGIFSAPAPFRLEELRTSIEEFNRQIQENQIERIERFEGRKIISPTEVEIIELERFFEDRRIPLFPILPPNPALARNSLIMTDLSIIEDPSRTYNVCTGVGTPMGAWTFGRLMTEMVNTAVTGVSTSDFVKSWMNTMNSELSINGDRIEPGMFEERIFSNWLAASEAKGLPPGELDLTIAPFRLLAIVNRIDLRENSGYASSNAGEARFVFGMIDTRSCRAIDHVTILEYGINKKGCNPIKDWAQLWYNLKNFPLGSTVYNSRLQAITDQFTHANAAPAKPNGSAINQVRTNELIDLAPAWDLKEFKLNPDNHLLENTFVAMTPKGNYLGGGSDARAIADFINTHEAEILRQNYEVPEFFKGERFLGSRIGTLSFGSPVDGRFWDGDVRWTPSSPPSQPGMVRNHKARHIFGLNTCNGCHTNENNTFTPFHMITFEDYGVQPKLVGFLTGVGGEQSGLLNGPTSSIYCAPDPAGRPVAGFDPCLATPETERGFNELNRRSQDLNDLVNTPCLINFLRFRPLNMVH